MKEKEEEVRQELRRLARDLESIRLRLWGIAAKAPDSEGETELDEPGVRTLIECIVTDSITPAIEDLVRVSSGEESAESDEASRAPKRGQE